LGRADCPDPAGFQDAFDASSSTFDSVMAPTPSVAATARSAAVLCLCSLVVGSHAAAQWLQLSPLLAPTARRGLAMCEAPNAAGAVLFGGTGNPLPSNQTWLYSGGSWTQLSVAPQPSGRIEMEMVHDAGRNVVVLYGGAGSTTVAASETWEFDGTNWTLIPTAISPGPRSRYGLCYDSARGRVVMYGGVGSGLGIPSNQTWEYDGVNWAQVVTATNPGALDRPAMCYHAALGRTVLFGGAFSSTLFDNTWTYDGVNWTQVGVNGTRPAVRNAAKMVYDSARAVCVLHGGQTAALIYDDTWEWNGAGWTQQVSPTLAARDHGLVFLPGPRQVVRFGGFTALPNVITDATWEFGARWTPYGSGCVGSNGVPSLTMPDAGRIGGNFTLALGNLNPASLPAVLVFSLSSSPGVSLDGIGMLGCLGFVAPDVLVAVPTAAGQAAFTWSPLPGNLGDRLYAQAVCLDPNVNPAWLTASNAIDATLDF
jgi:hypothetical protein